MSTLVGCSTSLAKQVTHATTIDPALLRIGSTHVTANLMVELSFAYKNIQPNVPIWLEQNSFAKMLDRLQHGDIDYFVSHHALASEDYWQIPIAQDGIAIITHPDNPIQSLALDEVRAIYQGELDNWDSLGGIAIPIVPILPSKDSAIRLEFERLVFGNNTPAIGSEFGDSEETILHRVQTQVGSIAFLPLHMVTDAVNLVAIDGVIPNMSTITDNLYPLRTFIYVIGLKPALPVYQSFFDWIQSAEGQEIVSQSHIALPD